MHRLRLIPRNCSAQEKKEQLTRRQVPVGALAGLALAEGGAERSLLLAGAALVLAARLAGAASAAGPFLPRQLLRIFGESYEQASAVGIQCTLKCTLQ